MKGSVRVGAWSQLLVPRSPLHFPVSDLPASPLGSCATLNEGLSFHFFLS